MCVLKLKKLRITGDPAEDTDATNKKYVDDSFLTVNYNIYRKKVVFISDKPENAANNKFWDGNVLRDFYKSNINEMWMPFWSTYFLNYLVSNYMNEFPQGYDLSIDNYQQELAKELSKPTHPLDVDDVFVIILDVESPINFNLSFYNESTIKPCDFVILEKVSKGTLLQSINFDRLDINNMKLLISNTFSNKFTNIDISNTSYNFKDVILKSKNDMYPYLEINTSKEVNFKNCKFENINGVVINADIANIHDINTFALNNFSANGKQITVEDCYGSMDLNLNDQSSFLNVFNSELHNSRIYGYPTSDLLVRGGKVFLNSIEGFDNIQIGSKTNANEADFNQIYPDGSAIYSPNSVLYTPYNFVGEHTVELEGIKFGCEIDTNLIKLILEDTRDGQSIKEETVWFQFDGQKIVTNQYSFNSLQQQTTIYSNYVGRNPLILFEINGGEWGMLGIRKNSDSTFGFTVRNNTGVNDYIQISLGVYKNNYDGNHDVAYQLGFQASNWNSTGDAKKLQFYIKNLNTGTIVTSSDVQGVVLQPDA